MLYFSKSKAESKKPGEADNLKYLVFSCIPETFNLSDLIEDEVNLTSTRDYVKQLLINLVFIKLKLKLSFRKTYSINVELKQPAGNLLRRTDVMKDPFYIIYWRPVEFIASL